MIQSIPTNSGVAPGGAVGGASSLTTVGAIPYVTSAGVLGQDATALFWDAANDRLGVGTGVPLATVYISASGGGAANGLGLHRTATGTGLQLYHASGWVINTTDPGDPLKLLIGGSEGARVAATTRNLLIGTTTDDGSSKLQVAGSARVSSSATGGTLYIGGDPATGGNFTGRFIVASNRLDIDAILIGSGFRPITLNAAGGNILLGGTTDGNYKLDIQSSGSTGTLRVFDQGGAGSTLAVIQAGAAQSGNLLSVRNNAGTEIMGMSLFGLTVPYTLSTNAIGMYFSGTTSSFPALKRSSAVLEARLADDSGYTDFRASSYSVGSGSTAYLGSVLELMDTGSIKFSSTSNATATKDTGLKRAAAGYVAVTDGSAGLGKIVVSQSTPSASTDAGTAGAIWADATYLYVQTASGTIKRVTLNAF